MLDYFLNRRKSFFVLLDPHTASVICITNYLEPLLYLQEIEMDSSLVELTYNNYFTYSLYNKIQKSGEAYLFKYDKIKQRLVMNNNIKDYLPQKYNLFMNKAYALTKIFQVVESARKYHKKELFMQDLVYLYKSEEADIFKSLNYPSDKILNFPFVLQYSFIRNISYKEAADEIIFKTKLFKGALSRTEEIRLVSVERIKKAKDMKELGVVFNELKQTYLM